MEQEKWAAFFFCAIFHVFSVLLAYFAGKGRKFLHLLELWRSKNRISLHRLTNFEKDVLYNRLCQTGGGKAGDRNQSVSGCDVSPKFFAGWFSSGNDWKNDGT